MSSCRPLGLRVTSHSALLDLGAFQTGYGCQEATGIFPSEPEEETEAPTLDYNDQIEREDYEDCE